MRQDNRTFDKEWIKATFPVEYVLQREGVVLQAVGDKYRGLCPLHRDTEPSLWVYPATRSWSCFGCPPKTGGDVIKWVQLRYNVSFLEACAHITGLPLPDAGTLRLRQKTAPPVDWEHLTAAQQLLMTTATAIYQDTLWRHPEALGYLKERGLTDATIRACGLGYSDGRSLAAFVEREEWTTRTARRLGLLRGSPRPSPLGDSREALAGHIVIPERRRGQAIWFIGRVLRTANSGSATSDQHDDECPKYRALRGNRPLLGHEYVAGRALAFVCEGPFDLLTAVQLGLPACCTCGPYLPIDRLACLSRAERIYGLHDGDHGGDVGAEWLAQEFGSRFERIPLPAGVDLNELGAMPDGAQRLSTLLHQQGVALEGRHAA